MSCDRKNLKDVPSLLSHDAKSTASLTTPTARHPRPVQLRTPTWENNLETLGGHMFVENPESNKLGRPFWKPSLWLERFWILNLVPFQKKGTYFQPRNWKHESRENFGIMSSFSEDTLRSKHWFQMVTHLRDLSIHLHKSYNATKLKLRLTTCGRSTRNLPHAIHSNYHLVGGFNPIEKY